MKKWSRSFKLAQDSLTREWNLYKESLFDFTSPIAFRQTPSWSSSCRHTDRMCISHWASSLFCITTACLRICLLCKDKNDFCFSHRDWRGERFILWRWGRYWGITVSHRKQISCWLMSLSKRQAAIRGNTNPASDELLPCWK